MDTQTAIKVITEAGRGGDREQVRQAAEYLIEQQLEERVVVRLNRDELSSWSKVVAGSWSNCDCDHEHCRAKIHRFIGPRPSAEVAPGGETVIIAADDTTMLRRKSDGVVVAMVEIEDGEKLVIRDRGRKQMLSLPKIIEHWNDLTIRERTLDFAEDDGFDAPLFLLEAVNPDNSITVVLDASFEAAASSQFRAGERADVGLKTIYLRRKGAGDTAALMALHIDFERNALHLTPLPFTGGDVTMELANTSMVLTPMMLGFMRDALFQLPDENRVLTITNGRDYRTTLFRFEAVDVRHRMVTIVLDDTVEEYDPRADLVSPKLSRLIGHAETANRTLN